jgi:hypothetical protein
MIMKKKPKHYYCNLFQENFYIYHQWTVDEIKHWFRKSPSVLIMNWNVAGRYFNASQDGVGIYHVVTLKGTNLGVLAHECVHAAIAMCDDKGIKIDRESETVAYLTQQIFNKGMEK